MIQLSYHAGQKGGKSSLKIINLMENTEGAEGLVAQHGLSFYIETEKHKLLMDLGPSEKTLENARKLGIDLTKVDTVILSHGHFDHGGGILPFAAINPGAKIYLQRKALKEYYAVRDWKPDPDYIGLDPEIAGLKQLVILDGEYRIDEELSLFSGIKGRKNWPVSNYNLRKKVKDGYVQDRFAHEQCLVVTEGGRKVLLSGCAHNGILNILDRYRELYGGAPDIVVSGFHMMKKTAYTDEERSLIRDTARRLRKYPTVFWTCHCTGLPAFDLMKRIMKEQLQYVHCGETVRTDLTVGKIEEERKRRKSYMKYHKFFAWATVVCFLITMATGYERK